MKLGNLFELRHLCRSEPPREGFPFSKFIAGCHRILKRDHGIRFIVSFSDPAHNGFKKRRRGVPYASGGIYAAANFKHLVKTDTERHVFDNKGDCNTTEDPIASHNAVRLVLLRHMRSSSEHASAHARARV